MIRRSVMSTKAYYPNGVYIEKARGGLYKASEWESTYTANSIVVIDGDVKFRIALKHNSSPIGLSGSYYTAFENVLKSYESLDDAYTDMDSEENTRRILSIESSESYAAGWCSSFKSPDSDTKWVLPSLGWLRIAFLHKKEIEDLLSLIPDSDAFSYGTWYYSSTFGGIGSGKRRFWIIIFIANESSAAGDCMNWDCKGNNFTFCRAFSNY